MSTYETGSIILQVLILVAASITAWVYYRQLQTMLAQLRTSQELTKRSHHIELIKLSISTPDIAKVWSDTISPEITFEDYQRHVFVNIHLSQLETLFELDDLSEESIRLHLIDYFKSKYYLSFWDNARSHRNDCSNLSSEKAKRFHQLCEEAYSLARKDEGTQPSNPSPISS